MKKVDDFIKEKMAKDEDFKARYAWTMQKAQIVKKIIKYRIKKKMTQTKLAKELGVTQQFISKIEEGEFSNLATVEMLLYHLGYGVKIKVVSLHKKSTKRRLATA